MCTVFLFDLRLCVVCCGVVGESVCHECVCSCWVGVGFLCVCMFFGVWRNVLFVGLFSVCLSVVCDEGIYYLLLINCVCLYL